MPPGRARRPGARRLAFWVRGAGLVLLLAGVFAPLPGLAAAGVIGVGLVLFIAGVLPWLLGTGEPWLRR